MAGIITWFAGSVSSMVNLGLGNEDYGSSPIGARAGLVDGEQPTATTTTTNQQRRQIKEGIEVRDKQWKRKDDERDKEKRADIALQGESLVAVRGSNNRQHLSTADEPQTVVRCFPRGPTMSGRSRPTSRRQSNAAGGLRHYLFCL
jgi:hypothetical protein